MSLHTGTPVLPSHPSRNTRGQTNIFHLTALPDQIPTILPGPSSTVLQWACLRGPTSIGLLWGVDPEANSIVRRWIWGVTSDSRDLVFNLGLGPGSISIMAQSKTLLGQECIWTGNSHAHGTYFMSHEVR